ncbi:flavodoxin family protein [Methanomethylovorans sp.]|uniref:flavodoxin family protein n=1 Tax=Methanomethylovorans sp. TaxID=2758717 RepID=UPI00351C0364
MKVVAFNGSPRKEGNTATLIKYVFEELEKEGIETELVHIGGKRTRGCTACMKCFRNKDMKCIFDDDFVNECIMKMVDADGIILASPTYFTDITTEMKALIDRAGFVSKANGDLFKRKVGASVVAVRRAGSLHAFTTMNNFFTIGQMIIPGSSYWNIGVGGAPGDVQKDEEGIRTMRTLGQNMAWLMKKLYS